MEIKTDISLSNFRTETRAWLELNCPESMRQPIKDPSDLYWGGRNAKFKSEDQRLWFERMFEKKWVVPYWETKYGGGGLSSDENNILTQEMIRLGCRKPLYSFGISMLGPALLNFASEEQKLKYLPKLLKGKYGGVKDIVSPMQGVTWQVYKQRQLIRENIMKLQDQKYGLLMLINLIGFFV
mgnify:CR=1 FL=1